MAKLTAKAVERELRKLRGNMSAVARVFGVSRQAIQYRVNLSSTLKQAVIDAREERLDNAESSLDRAIINGEAWAVCFSLKCQGKDRGYIETVKYQHGGDPDNRTPVPHEHTIINRIAGLADAFAGAADREEAGDHSGDRLRESLDSRFHQNGSNGQAS